MASPRPFSAVSRRVLDCWADFAAVSVFALYEGGQLILTVQLRHKIQDVFCALENDEAMMYGRSLDQYTTLNPVMHVLLRNRPEPGTMEVN